MKKICTLILLIKITFAGMAQYITPGTGVNWDLDDLVDHSSGVVFFDGEAYLIYNDLTISNNDVIAVESNEIIKISSNVLIEVQGNLQFQPMDSLVITAINSEQPYQGFRMDNTSGSNFTHCIFEFGNGIKLIQSDMVIQQCEFRYNGNEYSSGIIDLFQSSPLIANSVFYRNDGPAVMSSANGESAPFILNNQMTENVVLNVNMPQINLGTTASNDTIKIMGNTIRGMYDNAGGIAVSTLAGGNLNCVIENNEIIFNRYGIAVYGYNIFSVINNNVIHDNNIQGDPYLGGSGINFYGGSSNVSRLSGNEIYNNLWGITVQIEAIPDLGTIEDENSPGMNRIYNNSNIEGTFGIYNNTPNNLNAQNNFWGSMDPEEVEDYIFHYPDDNTLGLVNYLPLWDTLSGTKRMKLNNVIKAYPNPAIDFINLEMSTQLVKNNDVCIVVYDVFGRIRKQMTVSNEQIIIPVSDLEKGIYFLGFDSGDYFDKIIFHKCD